MLKINTIFLIFASIFFAINFAYSDSNVKTERSSYKCTKTSNTNFRNGPGVKFTIIYKILKKGYPVKIIDSIDSWFAIEDFKGDKMWVSSINLTSKCGAITLNKTEAKLSPKDSADLIFTLDQGFVINDIKCYQKWCEAKIEGKKVWLLKKHYGASKFTNLAYIIYY